MTYFAAAPWAWLIDSWRSADRLRNKAAPELPVTVFSASADALIDPYQHERVARAAEAKANRASPGTGGKVRLLKTADAGHDALGQQVSAHLAEYRTYMRECLGTHRVLSDPL
jgi:alpha-beta hydrolase superfamily lysophospholipase